MIFYANPLLKLKKTTNTKYKKYIQYIIKGMIKNSSFHTIFYNDDHLLLKIQDVMNGILIKICSLICFENSKNVGVNPIEIIFFDHLKVIKIYNLPLGCPLSCSASSAKNIYHQRKVLGKITYFS